MMLHHITSYHDQILSSLQQIHLKNVKDIYEQIIMNALEKNNCYCKKTFMHSNQKIIKIMQPIPRAKATMTELLYYIMDVFQQIVLKNQKIL